MNILIIIGHPKNDSHSHQIAETYKNRVEKLKNEVKMIDVYSKECILPYATFIKDSLSKEDMKKIDTMKEMITWSNEIVIVHPVWWGAMPAGLKNWMDIMFSPRFAYKYNEKGKAEPLLIGRTAKLFATAGSYAPYYRIPIIKDFTPLHLIWKYNLLGFCGIDLIEMKVQDKMNTNNSCPPVGCFEAFLKKIEKSAETH